jgi:DinB superfamily
MKKLLLFLAVIGFASFIPATTGLTEAERNTATKFLSDTENGVLESIKGLSEAQLTFKAAPDKWSVEDCVKHIAATETGLWQMTDGNIKQPANPEKRTEIKWSDEDVMKNIEDRTNKIKTFPPFEPQNTGFKTLTDAVTSFKENRGKLIEYVKTTDQDLRNHVATLPVGSFDCYQMLLFIGAHSNRHMQQINEVKADPNFPKN